MKVGDVYTTRDGRVARVTRIQEKDGLAIIEIPSTLTRTVYIDSGLASCPGNPYPFDLILPPKTVKAQRVIEYEGTKEWVESQLIPERTVCSIGKQYTTYYGNIIREVSRKFL